MTALHRLETRHAPPASRKVSRTPCAPLRACAAAWAALLLLPAAGQGASTPATPDTSADDKLVAAVCLKAATVLRLASAATNTPDLSLFICPPSPPVELITNTTETVLSNRPVSEVNFELRGLSSGTGPRLALVNGRWVGVGDLVSANGMRISRIGGDHVVLIDTQGVRQVVALYRNRK